MRFQAINQQLIKMSERPAENKSGYNAVAETNATGCGGG